MEFSKNDRNHLVNIETIYVAKMKKHREFQQNKNFEKIGSEKAERKEENKSGNKKRSAAFKKAKSKKRAE